VRFLRRMGFSADEVDYGVVAVEPHVDADLDAASLDGYLRIWQRVHARAAVDLEPAAGR
jgi:hypothetical protein